MTVVNYDHTSVVDEIDVMIGLGSGLFLTQKFAERVGASLETLQRWSQDEQVSAVFQDRGRLRNFSAGEIEAIRVCVEEDDERPDLEGCT